MRIWIFTLLLMCVSLPAWAQDIALAEPLSVSGTVDAVDYAKRILTLNEPSGDALIFAVDKSVDGLDQIKSGDRVSLKYYDSIVLFLRKPADPPFAQDEVSATMPSEDGYVVDIQLPVSEESAKVTAINYATRDTTIQFESGKAVAFNARNEISNFYLFMTDDNIVASITEPVVVYLDKSQS